MIHQIQVATTWGQELVPAIVLGQLAVNRDPVGVECPYSVTHVPTGVVVIRIGSAVKALKVARALEVLDWSWLRSVTRPVSGIQVIDSHPPDEFVLLSEWVVTRTLREVA